MDEKISVLVVDDELELLLLYKTMLEMKKGSYGIHTVDSPVQAIEMMKKKSYDVLLTDYRMPEMDGIQLIEKAKEIQPDIQAIVITGYGQVENAVKALRLGSSHYLIKPVSVEDLHFTVNEAWKKKKNIEEQRQARERLFKVMDQLRESERKFREIFNNINEFVFINEKGTPENPGKFLEVNQRTVDVLGYSRDELFSMTPEKIQGQAGNDKDEPSGFEEVQNMEAVYIAKDGTRIPVELNSHKTRISGKNVVITVARDIRERKSFEEQLIHRQKYESLGTLAGGVAHEINNPINGIMNYAQLIIDEMKDNPEVSEYAGEIISETERVAGIVRNLLYYARQDVYTQESESVPEMIENALTLIRTIFRHDHIDLKVEVPRELPKINCQTQRIQQVFINLMTNARDSLNDKYPGYHENKKLIISAREVKKDGNRWIRITVKDHGNGIDDSIRNQIFDPFFSTKSKIKGTGLGLSISYGIIQDHHGLLEVTSKKGEYASFHIFLPLEKERVV